MLVAAAPIAAVGASRAFPTNEHLVRQIIRVRVPDAVWAQPLHHHRVVTPMLWPCAHMMVARVVDAAGMTFAALRWVAVDLLTTF